MDVDLVREALPSDRERLREIVAFSFPRFFRFFANQSVDSKDGRVLVLEVQGAVAGFSKLIDFQVGGGKYGCILWIAVHPTFRRRGIALNLAKAGLDVLKKDGAELVFASTQIRNRAARGTLGKAGFSQMGFLGLWRIFDWRVFSFYREIWYAPGEIVLMHNS
jgi:ribosomal protein S18 acetylase RimI-like enzyme